jgi:cell division protein FtsB
MEENADLRQKLEEVKSPEYTEMIARDKLGYVKDGEAIVLFQATSDSQQETEKTDNLPHWKQWWKLFF